MYRYKLTIAYDGSDYHGMQRLNDHKSIQKTLEIALKRMTSQEVKVFTSGRTDKGVHAKGQVVHFDFMAELDNNTLMLGLNKRLPEDVRVVKAELVNNNFHARHDAKSKEYEYVISKTESNVFAQRYEVYYPNLDIDKLKEAAKLLEGTHDFGGFTVTNDLKPTIKIIYSIKIKETKTHIKIRIHGNSFLRYQIRRMVGLLVEIGQGKKDISKLFEILETKNQNIANKTAPAKGLYLVKIYY
ncbi:MAG: tRNA pseudouridine(38-40) synthase TruA [Acholeplasmataceae bacterium]|jgi:tRNA pseudouridine38-40 synthase